MLLFSYFYKWLGYYVKSSRVKKLIHIWLVHFVFPCCYSNAVRRLRSYWHDFIECLLCAHTFRVRLLVFLQPQQIFVAQHCALHCTRVSGEPVVTVRATYIDFNAEHGLITRTEQASLVHFCKKLDGGTIGLWGGGLNHRCGKRFNGHDERDRRLFALHARVQFYGYAFAVRPQCFLEIITRAQWKRVYTKNGKIKTDEHVAEQSTNGYEFLELLSLRWYVRTWAFIEQIHTKGEGGGALEIFSFLFASTISLCRIDDTNPWWPAVAVAARRFNARPQRDTLAASGGIKRRQKKKKWKWESEEKKKKRRVAVVACTRVCVCVMFRNGRPRCDVAVVDVRCVGSAAAAMLGRVWSWPTGTAGKRRRRGSYRDKSRKTPCALGAAVLPPVER